MTDGDWYDDVVLPALLVAARSTYRTAIRKGLADAGFNDLPRRGGAVVGGIVRNGPAKFEDLRRGLLASDAFVAHLLDTLEDRGYVEQHNSGDDVEITVTDRGRAAAAATRAAIERVDAALAERVGADAVADARRVLGAIADLDPS
jgi:DNA-binding MarR family transcriptional regulator